jgi:hypothetical protein
MMNPPPRPEFYNNENGYYYDGSFYDDSQQLSGEQSKPASIMKSGAQPARPLNQSFMTGPGITQTTADSSQAILKKMHEQKLLQANKTPTRQMKTRQAATRRPLTDVSTDDFFYQ